MIRYYITPHGKELIRKADSSPYVPDLDLLESLVDNPNQTLEELSQELGQDEKLVKIGLNRLVKSGRVIGWA